MKALVDSYQQTKVASTILTLCDSARCRHGGVHRNIEAHPLSVRAANISAAHEHGERTMRIELPVVTGKRTFDAT